MVGWYTTGKPTTDIFEQHKAFTAQVEGAILVLFDISLDFPVRAYETNLAGDSLIEAEYSIETGEAERIAVDATRVGQDDQGGHAVWVQILTITVAGHLTTQRNAIAMLYERMQVIQKHVALNPDLAILRQVSSLLATLPIMDADSFRDELHTVSPTTRLELIVQEYSDVRLTEYLSTVLKQLDSLNDVCCFAFRHGYNSGQKLMLSTLTYPDPSRDAKMIVGAGSLGGFRI